MATPGFAPDPSRLDRLESEVEKTKQRLDAKSTTDRLKTWGAIVALVVAIFALPRGFVDSYKAVVSKPNIRVKQSPDLHITYDPGKQTFGFEPKFTISNLNGSKDDMVESLEAKLSNVSDSSPRSLRFEGSDIQCSSEGGTHVTIPFPVQVGSVITTTCKLPVPLAKSNDNPLSQLGKYHLSVALTRAGQRTSTPLDFCFELFEQNMKDLFQETSENLKHTVCGQGSAHGVQAEPERSVKRFLPVALSGAGEYMAGTERHGELAPNQGPIEHAAPGDVATGRVIRDQNNVLDLDTSPCDGSRIVRFHDHYDRTVVGQLRCGNTTFDRVQVRQR